MRERTLTFGDGVRLVGVLTDGADRTVDDARPAAVLLNAGLIHRVGPYRLNVDLARELAAQGFSALRFDLSGLGDSDTRRDSRSESHRVQADVRDALDVLEARRVARRFVLIGLCSGADNAHLVARDDDRVAGVVYLDGLGYRTRGFTMRHYGARLKRGKLAKAIRRRLGKLGGQLQQVITPPPELEGSSPGEGSTPGEDRPESFDRNFPPAARGRADLARLVARGCELLFVYSGGVKAHYFNHIDQFEEMFPGLRAIPRVAVEHYVDSDHTYTIVDDRQRLIARIVRWMTRRFG